MERWESSEEVVMEKKLYLASMEGNVEFLNNAPSDEYLLRKSHEKNNIIHVAIRHEQYEFIKAAVKRFPKLIHEGNSYGNTPLHVVVEVGNLSILRLIHEEYLKSEVHHLKPWSWRTQNLKGNTLAHVAILQDEIEIVHFLMDKDLYLARIVNKSNEAPLHLALKCLLDQSRAINEGGGAFANPFQPKNKMVELIRLLVEKESCVACWHDANGLTPLHRAASLEPTYNMTIIRIILHHCPQSAEVCDKLGKILLHHLNGVPSYNEGMKLLGIPEVYVLKNFQDQQGNTPLHVAIENKNNTMVRVLLDSLVKRGIKNMKGISAESLMNQQNLFEMMEERMMTKEECQAVDGANMKFLQKRLNKFGIDFLRSQDSRGRNILHRLMQIKNGSHILLEDFINFVRQALECFPQLMCHTDLDGNTPVHLLVQNDPSTIMHVASRRDNPQVLHNHNSYMSTILWKSDLLSSLLNLYNQYSLSDQEEFVTVGTCYTPIWLVQNVEGNTPLHEALIANNSTVTTNQLLRFDSKVAKVINRRKETLLHLLSGYYPCDNDDMMVNGEYLDFIIRENVQSTTQCDKDGLTPLLRAFCARRTKLTVLLYTYSPESIKSSDTKGRTLYHLLANEQNKGILRAYECIYFSNDDIRNLLKSQDDEGNTPLHLAIEGQNFDLAQFFLDPQGCMPLEDIHEWQVGLLQIQNKFGTSPGDLIGSSLHLPPKFENFVAGQSTMIGVRSMWGVPTTQMKEHVNTMGVIAALLVTITFTAAFTVPGGLVEDKGTPLLTRKVAFQIFMISDVLAMCLSMMVLFCLLWIMATGNKGKSVVLLDFSIILLLASFHITLLTFMTGLYATIFPVKPGIAIFTLVLCSLLMLLMHKYLVKEFLIPLWRVVLIFFQKFLLCSSQLCRRMT